MKKTTIRILKSFISFTLTLALILGALPLPQFTTEARADSQTVIDATTTDWSGNMVVNSNVVINGNVNLFDDTILTIADGKTLTVNGFINGQECGFEVNGGNLIVIGDSIICDRITFNNSNIKVKNMPDNCIYCMGLDPSKGPSIINNSKVEVTGVSRGINCEALTITNNSFVTATGGSNGICALGDLTIDNNSEVKATSTNGGSAISCRLSDETLTFEITNSRVEAYFDDGRCVECGILKMNDGELKVQGADGIECDKFLITDSRVNAIVGSEGYGISCFSHATSLTSTITNSRVEVSGGSKGISCEGLEITDNSKVTVDAIDYGIDCGDDLTITGSEVKAVADDGWGIYCSPGDTSPANKIKITDSKVEATGNSGIVTVHLEIDLSTVDAYFMMNSISLNCLYDDEWNVVDEGTIKITKTLKPASGTGSYSGTYTNDSEDLEDLSGKKLVPSSPTRVSTPAFSPAAGFYAGTQSVTLSCATDDASIYYTLDDTTPSETNGTLYAGPISVANTKTIKAIAIKEGMTSSYVRKARYTIASSSATLYPLTVTNGTGGGSYPEGQTVTITANAAPSGKEFAGWSGADGLTFMSGSATASPASFIMPANAVSLTANYKIAPTLTVSNITKTYDGSAVTASQISGTVKVNGSVIAGTWSFASGQSLTDVSDSGLKTVVFTPADQDLYKTVSTTLNLTINPKTVDIPGAAANLKWTGLEQTGVEEGEGYTLTDNKATNVGNYTATATLESDNYIWSDNTEEEKTISWSIQKADAVYTAPALITDLIYTGNAQDLITAGSVSSGMMYYALGENGTTAPDFDGLSEAENKTWKTTVPKGTDPGTYYVWYLVKGDNSHNDTEAVCLEVIVKCRVSFEKGEDTATGTMEPVGVVKGGTYTLPSSGFTPPEGKKLKNWSVRIGDSEPVSKAVGDVITISDNTVITAVFKDLGAKGTEENPWQVDSWSDLYDALEEGGYVKLTGNVTYGAGKGENRDKTLLVPENKAVILDLAGFSIDRGLANASPSSDGDVIKVRGNLTLNDSSDKTFTTEYDGTGMITGGNSVSSDGSISVLGGVFTMNGGAIDGNLFRTASVHIVDGTFTMNDGKICNNSTNGIEHMTASVYILCGTFTMNGGEISNNRSDYCGGVIIESESDFVMNGGTICDNKALDGWGGGVSVYAGNATMNGGTIKGNISGRGGGVYVASGCIFKMYGGSIIGNHALSGGGVDLESGNMSVSGNAVIKDNVAGGTMDEETGMYTGGTPSNVEGVFHVTGKLSDDACIGVNLSSGTGVFAKGVEYTITDDDIKHFENTDRAYMPVLDAENNTAVLKKSVTVSGIKAKNKDYDGNREAELDLSGVTIIGVDDGDEISVSANGIFDSASSGKDKTVTISDIRLGGDDADQYALAKEGQQTSATADIAKAGGSCGENVAWTFDDGEGTLIINGNGSIMDYDDPAPWTVSDFSGEIKHAAIQEGVTTLGNQSFAGLTNLEDVALPEGLTTIGDDAFASDENLKEITIPQSVTAIGNGAFQDCTALSHITYGGTKEQWEEIAIDEEAGLPGNNLMIDCTDEDVVFASLDLCTVDDIPAQVYTGKPIKPELNIAFNGYELKEGTDYTAVYTANTNVGTASITVTGTGSVEAGKSGKVTGTRELTFNIGKADNEVTVSANSWTYGETAAAMGVKAVFGADAVAYSYSSAENGAFTESVPKAAGTWYVKATVAGTDNYNAASDVKRFVIAKRPITVTAGSAIATYNGSALTENTYTYSENGLADGDTFESVTVTGSRTEEGTGNNVPSAAKIVNAAGEDVTASYDITYENGTLTVLPKEEIKPADGDNGTGDNGTGGNGTGDNGTGGNGTGDNGTGGNGTGDNGTGGNGTGGNGTGGNGTGNGTGGNGTGGNGTGGNGTENGTGNGSGNSETPGNQDQQVKVGDIVTDETTKAMVKITSDKSGNETAEYAGPANKNAKSAVVPDTVTIGKKTVKITTIRANAFKGSKVTKVTLGKNIKKLSPKAFNGSKVSTITAKTTKLTKKSVKNCLKGSKAKKITLKVKVGSKSKNKKYRNLYKKYFTAKNAGKKATVK